MENNDNEKFTQKTKDQELLDAIEIGYNNNFSSQDWINIINCLENGANINLLIGQGQITPLTMAVMYHNQELFYYLLKKGALVNACNQSGWTALHYMSSLLRKHPTKFNIEMFKDLLKHGANTSAQTKKSKKTPLFFIAKYGNEDLIKLLIQHKADINQFSGKYKPLWLAVRKNNFQTTKALLHYNASLAHIDEHDCTIFHIMTYHNKPKELFEMILTHARFNPPPTQKIININKSIDASALELLLILNKSINLAIPKELHFRILSMLPIEYFQDPNSILCKKLLSLGYKNSSILAHVNRHIHCLQKIVSFRNNTTGATALEYAQSQNPAFSAQIKPLLNPDNLKNELTIFYENFPHILNSQSDNLASKIYKNYSKSSDI